MMISETEFMILDLRVDAGLIKILGDIRMELVYFNMGMILIWEVQRASSDGLNCVPPQKRYVEVLTPNISEYDHICE